MSIVARAFNDQIPDDQRDSPAAVMARLYLSRLVASPVPQHLHEGLVMYLAHHRRPGSFLLAVLQNDLSEAHARADLASLAGLHALVTWLLEIPAGVWGSPEKVARHLASRTQEQV